MNILFIGPPGSGKGTQSKILQEKYGLVHLSTGDMFRQAIAERTKVGLEAKRYMDRGDYVPDEVVIELIRERLGRPDIKDGFILDGFPRTEPQANALDQLLHDLGISLGGIFFFDVNTEILVNRLSGRRTCRACGRIVGIEQLKTPDRDSPCPKNPGIKCDFFQRDDDKPEVVQNRIEVYRKQTTPVIDHYSKSKAFHHLNGSVDSSTLFKQIESKMRG